jgi:hypothetical protein
MHRQREPPNSGGPAGTPCRPVTVIAMNGRRRPGLSFLPHSGDCNQRPANHPDLAFLLLLAAALLPASRLPLGEVASCNLFFSLCALLAS